MRKFSKKIKKFVWQKIEIKVSFQISNAFFWRSHTLNNKTFEIKGSQAALKHSDIFFTSWLNLTSQIPYEKVVRLFVTTLKKANFALTIKHINFITKRVRM